jgi:hypothetical protein
MIVLSQRLWDLDRRWLAALLTVLAAIAVGRLAASAPLGILILLVLGAFGWLAYRWPWVGVWLFVGVLALTPAYVGVVVGQFGAWTPTRALGAVYAIVIFARSGLHPSRWNALDVAFGVFLMASFLFFPLKGTGITASAKVGMYTALDYGVPYLLMRTYSSDMQSTLRLLGTVTFWAVVVGLFALIEEAFHYNPFLELGPVLSGEEQWTTVLYRGGGQRAVASFSHPISLGMFAALLLPVALWLALQASSKRRMLTIAAGALVIAGMLIATLSRGPWLGALLAIVVALLIRPSSPRSGRIVLALGIAATWLLYASGISPLTTVINESFDPSTSDFANFLYRQGLIPLMLELWSHSPIIGFQDLSAAATSIDNYYLVQLVLNGLVGLLAFWGVMAAVGYRLWSVVRAPAATSTGMAADCATILLGVLAGQLIVLASVAMVGSAPYFFWGFIGIVAGAWASRRPTSSPSVAQFRPQRPLQS